MARTDRESGLPEQVIDIRFHTKVTKGGRNLSIGAVVAVGDQKGKVGLGYGKARAVPEAIEKAVKEARANMVRIQMVGDTVAHEIRGRHGSAEVLLMPASQGTGVKAGRTVRAILDMLGVRNILSKVYGPTNPLNVAKATMNALTGLRSVAEVEALRGVEIKLRHPQAATMAVADEGQAGEAAVEQVKPEPPEPQEAEEPAEVPEHAEAATGADQPEDVAVASDEEADTGQPDEAEAEAPEETDTPEEAGDQDDTDSETD